VKKGGIKMKRSNYIFVFVCVLMLVTASDVTAKQQKVSICHITGNRNLSGEVLPIGHVISIAESALQSHINHGDFENWSYMTLSDGTEVCTAPMAAANDPEPDPAPDSCYQVEGGKMIFLTFDSISVDMKGISDQIDQIEDPIDRADAVCNHFAQKAGLCGTYRAWMSANGAPAPLPPSPSFPLVLTNGDLVANNSDDINKLTEYLEDPISVDEWGFKWINILQTTPRIVWKGTSDYVNAFGYSTCCGPDDQLVQCSRVGYAINAMGLDAYLNPNPLNVNFSDNLFNFTYCATFINGTPEPSRMYCIQQ